MKVTFKNITKHFGAVEALNDVSFTVKEGRILGLLGENGAGKSTLMNLLGGVLKPTSGSIQIDDTEYSFLTTKKAFDLGISFIHQELNLVNDLKVYENLFLNHEITKYGFLNKKKMIEEAQRVFEIMNVDIDPEAFVRDIDTSRKQLVEIAKAVLFKSHVIIFDEPTTALTDQEIDILFKIMKEFKKQGISLIYISHKMPELFKICDDYVVLRDGKYIAEGLFSSVDEQQITELLVGKSFSHNQTFISPIKENQILYQVDHLTSKPYFEDISFHVKKGEVIAITGLFGDGRGELSDALFGAHPIDSGDIYLKDKKVKLSSIRGVMKAGISMVPRNRKERSIIKDMHINDNLSIAHFNCNHKKLLISKKEELSRYEKNKKSISIKANSPYDLITSLSGGNQQKIIFSRWFELNSDVYILDNPTQGIDVGAKSEVYELIKGLTEQGKGVIVFSAEYPEIFKIAHRCVVMYRGRINKVLERKDFDEFKIMYYSTGANQKEENHGTESSSREN